MNKTQQYSELLDQLFNSTQHPLKIDINVLRQICASNQYKKLIDITAILFKLFLTGKHQLSVRELIGQSMLINLKGGEERGKNGKEEKIVFFADGLNGIELSQIIVELYNLRKKLKNTVYSLRLNQIIELLKVIAQQLNVGAQKTNESELSFQSIGDFQYSTAEITKFQNANTLQFMQRPSTKISDFLKTPRPYFQGKFSNHLTLQKIIAIQVLPLLQRNLYCIPLNNHTQREGELSRVLKFIANNFIMQYQIQIEISKNTLVQTRIYTNKIYRELLLKDQKIIIRSLAKILNQAILCPSSIHIQIMLLRILRRLYFLWEYSTVHSSEHIQTMRRSQNQDNNTANVVKYPLFLTLRNIALFSSGSEDELKEAAMLCYKIVQQKNDLQLATMLQTCEQLRFLKTSKFYSSKAFTYADQIQKIYDPLQLGSIYWKMHQLISPRQMWTYRVIIQKPSSLLCWQFYLGGYDIRFGVFKLEHLREFGLQEYEKGVDCKEVVRLEKVQSLGSNACKGHLYLKNGVYNLVFDNSFSMMRSKQLFYSILHLQCSV